jgi:hypothetical protein
MLAGLEERWTADPVPSYRIVVDVDRPGERRRNDVTVTEGRVTHASSSN